VVGREEHPAAGPAEAAAALDLDPQPAEGGAVEPALLDHQLSEGGGLTGLESLIALQHQLLELALLDQTSLEEELTP